MSTEDESPAARSHSRHSTTARTRSDTSAASGAHPEDAGGAARRPRTAVAGRRGSALVLKMLCLRHV